MWFEFATDADALGGTALAQMGPRVSWSGAGNVIANFETSDLGAVSSSS